MTKITYAPTLSNFRQVSIVDTDGHICSGDYTTLLLDESTVPKNKHIYHFVRTYKGDQILAVEKEYSAKELIGTFITEASINLSRETYLAPFMWALEN